MEGLGLFSILILVGDIYAILRIAQSSEENIKKALWIAGVIVLPILGLIVWYLMGPGRPR